jgi:hypothetical protein|tara:strand:- start:243 stop:422 length:180 start_codon:yes stop_codon:yes gene_type:complete
MNEQMMKDISNWEHSYLKENVSKLNERQKEILNGSELKSNEGMLFGQMYADWKKQKGYE